MSGVGVYGTSNIINILRSEGLANKKRWGQNFIIERTIAQKIAAYAHHLVQNIRPTHTGNQEHRLLPRSLQGQKVSETDSTREQGKQPHMLSTIWEIGPGLGALTDCLYELCDENLCLFEIDHGMVKLLENRMNTSIETHITNDETLPLETSQKKNLLP